MSPRAVALGLLTTLAGCESGEGTVFFGPSSVSYGNGVWVGVQLDDSANPMAFGGDLVMWASTDGVSWSETARYPDLDAVGEVAFTNGMFLTLASPVALRSDDGVTWTTVTNPPPGPTYGIAGGDGRFVAFNYYRGFVTTTDGLTWTEGPDSTKEIWQSASIAYAAGRFFAYGDTTFILESSDAMTWQWVETGLFDTSDTHVSSVGTVAGAPVAFAAEYYGAGEGPGPVRYYRLDRTPSGWAIQEREPPQWFSFVELDDGRLAAVSRAEIAVSDDAGATWRIVHEFDLPRGKQIASDGAGTLVAASRQPMVSVDRGETWAPASLD
jgi:hypothetical protein